MYNMNPAGRRYLKRFTPAMILYVVALFAANWLISAYKPHGVALVALAVLPALPLVAVIAIMGLYLAEETDEFLQRRLVVAMLGGTGILLALATVWGFLEEAGVVLHLPAYWAFIIWCAGMGITQCVTAVREVRAGTAE